MSYVKVPIVYIKAKIENLIKKDLKHYNIEWYENILNEWGLNKWNNEEKEILYSLYCFYWFLSSKEIIEFSEKINNILDNNILLLFKYNKKIYEFFISILDKEDFILLLSIVVTKSFTDLSNFYNNKYNFNFNSDEILTKCSDTVDNYLIYEKKKRFNKREYRTFFLKIISCLVENKIIKEEIIDDPYKDFGLIRLWNNQITFNLDSVCENYHISFCRLDYIKIDNEVFIIGKHFSKVYRLYKKNYSSDKNFEIKDESYINQILDLYLYFDLENAKWIKNILTENTTLENIKKEIIYSMEMIKFWCEKKNWTNEKDINLINYQKNFSKKMEEYTILKFVYTTFEENQKIYFIPNYDFRGRRYYYSKIGFTSSKISRFIFHYGWYETNDFKNFKKIDRIWEFKEIIKNFCIKNQFYYNDKFLETVFWLLIGIGKHLVIKKDIFINDFNFITNGIKVIEEGIENFKLKLIDRIEIIHYITILKSLGLNKIPKRGIIKDGTASGYAVKMMYLGPKNEESLFYVNLFSSKHIWVDTYSLQTNMFIKYFLENEKKVKELYGNLTNEDIKNNLEILLERNITKPTWMTIPYNEGIDSCKKKFFQALVKKDKNITIDDTLSILFEYFYKFAKNIIEKEYFYETTSKNFNNKIIKEFINLREIKIKSDTGIADIGYNKLEEKVIDIKLPVYILSENKFIKRRITKLMKNPSLAIDISQTKKALNANYTHFYDGEVIRKLETKINKTYITIHDSYIIDFFSCSHTILALNEVFQEELDKLNLKKTYKINSIFIII